MKNECLILTTGGTIDKVYFDAKSRYAVGDSQVGELFEHGHVSLPYEIVSLMRKDSLDFTDTDRLAVRKAIEQADNRMILVTHGTDTMTETGMALKGIPGKTIVLTGALLPARFRDNDAIFNIGFAFAAVQTLPEGVYVAMNGRIFDPAMVKKDRERNQFVDIDGASVD
ncbi:MAG: asparaginase domain-containing protein [Puniceicoccaceae bacterium]